MSWIKIEEFNFEDSKCIHVDTRDFHCTDGGFIMPFSFKEVKEVNEEFFLTDEKAKQLLLDIKSYSGGDCEWRYLSFDSVNCDNWKVKYFRLFKTNRGWLICNSYKELIHPETLKEERLEKEHLNNH